MFQQQNMTRNLKTSKKWTHNTRVIKIQKQKKKKPTKNDLLNENSTDDQMIQPILNRKGKGMEKDEQNRLKEEEQTHLGNEENEEKEEVYYENGDNEEDADSKKEIAETEEKGEK